jgi:hypothetical protein
MSSAIPTISISPRIGALLTQVTETPDLETALWKVLSEYIDLKISSLAERIKEFNKKWGMTFEEFSERFEAGTLDQDSYAYVVESDFWEWEKVETLLDHYKSLQSRWM